MSCSHLQYGKPRYMPADEAMAAMKGKNATVCRISWTVKTCATCGEDIRHLRLVKVQSFEEYMKSLGVEIRLP